MKIRHSALILRKNHLPTWFHAFEESIRPKKSHKLSVVFVDSPLDMIRELAEVAHDKHNPKTHFDDLLLPTETFADETLRGVRILLAAGFPRPRLTVILDKDDVQWRQQLALLGIQEVCGLSDSLVMPLVHAITLRAEQRRDLLDDPALPLRALADQSSDGVFIFRDDRLLYANERFRQIFGLQDTIQPEESYIVSQSFHPRIEWMTLVKKAQYARLDEPATHEDIHLEGQDITGRRFPVHVALFPFGSNRQSTYVGVIQDLSADHHLRRTLSRKNLELEALRALETSIAEARHLTETLEIACQRVHDLTGAKATGIVIRDAESQQLRLTSHRGLPTSLREKLERVSLSGQTLLAHCVQTGLPSVIDDAKRDPRIKVQAVREQNFEGAAVIPLKTHQETVGAMFVFLPLGRDVHQDDVTNMEAMGIVVGNAIDKAVLADTQQQAIERLNMLGEIAFTTARLDNFDGIIQATAASLKRFLKPKLIAYYQYDNTHHVFHHIELKDVQPMTLPYTIAHEDTLLGVSNEMRRTIQRIRPAQLEKFKHRFPLLAYQLFQQGFGTLVATPVRSEHATQGGFILGFESSHPIDTKVIEALDTLTTHIGTALSKVELLSARDQALDDLKSAQESLLRSERLQAMGQLASGVAHDFNNLLSSVLGQTELLENTLRQEKKLSTEQLQHALLTIRTAALDGAHIVRRLRPLAKHSSRETMELADVSELIDQTCHYAEQKISKKSLVLRHAHEPHVFIKCHPPEIREVLLNLVGNAIDACPEAGHIGLFSSRAPDGFVEIAVCDTGHGVSDDFVEKLFQPFVTSKKEKGTGLGLSVSASIAEKHGGSLHYQRHPFEDYETGFILRLPDASPPMTENHITDLPRPASEPSADAIDTLSSNKRILVIDDEENIREILNDLLSTLGCDVYTCSTGAAGLNAIQEHDYALVMTDINLPDISGKDVITTIKTKYPKQKVAIVTGLTTFDDHLQSIIEQCDDVIRKPFTLQRLQSMVEKLAQ